MIIWSGWGILVVGFAVAGMVLGGLVGAGSNIGLGIGLALSALPIWLVGRRLNDPSSARTLVDPQTGQTVVFQRTHSLFWIPMQWWAIAALVLAIPVALSK